MARSDGILWFVLIAALAVLGIFFFFKAQSQLAKGRPLAIFSSLIGLGVLLYKGIEFMNGQETPFGTIRPSDIGLTLQFGVFGTIIGFLLALLGAIFMRTVSLPITPFKMTIYHYVLIGGLVFLAATIYTQSIIPFITGIAGIISVLLFYGIRRIGNKNSRN